jgi:hypothetical protein
MDLGSIWDWEGRKLNCKIRVESGNPAADTLREAIADLMKVDYKLLLENLKEAKKENGKLSADGKIDKIFKDVQVRSRTVGAGDLAMKSISTFDQKQATTVTQKNIKKMYTVLPKSPPKRVLLDIQREKTKLIEENVPNKEHRSAAEKLEKRLAKQKAARLAAIEKAAKEEEALNKRALQSSESFLESLRSKPDVFVSYSGDLFSSGGNYLEGMVYLSRMAESSEKAKKSTSGMGDYDDPENPSADLGDSDKGHREKIASKIEEEDLSENNNHPDINVKLSCALSLCNWSRNPANATRLASEGAVRAIIQLSQEKYQKVTKYCAAAFRFMSEFPVLAISMVEEGAVKTICELVNVVSDDFLLHNLAIALVNVTRINGKEAQVVESGVIFSAFVHLISSKPELGATCVRGLYNLTCVDAYYPSIERVIRAIVQLVTLSAAGTVTPKVKHICAAALCNLSDLRNARPRMVEEGTIGSLQALCKGAETRTRRICAVILQNLSSTSSNGKIELASRQGVNLAYSLSSDQDPIILRCVGLTLSRLATEASNCQRIIKENGISALCNIAVKYPTIPGITQPVAAAFQLLSINKDDRTDIVKDGSITAIASLLRSSVDMFTLQHSLLALCNFILEPENHAPIFQMGLVTTLVAMCGNENDVLKDFCSLAFLNLSRTEESRKQLVNAGAVSAIISIAQHHSAVTKKRCAATLCNLSYHAAGMSKMVGEGIIPCIVDLVIAKDITTVHYACAALCRLCSAVENARLILDSGAVPNLVHGAVSGDPVTKQFCGAVLSSLSYYEYCRIPLSDFGAIEALKGLAALNNDVTKQRCLVAFANLSCEVSVQMKMIREGVVGIIAELANSYQEINYICCAKAICNLACCEGAKLTVAKDGGFHALMMISMVQSVDRLTKILCVLGLNNLLDQSTVQFMVTEGLIGSIANLSKIGESKSGDVKSGDSHIANLCAKIYNHASRYSVARAKMAGKGSYLNALFRLCDSPVQETRLLSYRTCCNLVSDIENRDSALHAGVLICLEKGLQHDDTETMSHCCAALHSTASEATWMESIAKSTLAYSILDLLLQKKVSGENLILLTKVLAIASYESIARPHLQNSGFMGKIFRLSTETQIAMDVQWLTCAVRHLVSDYSDTSDLFSLGVLDTVVSIHQVVSHARRDNAEWQFAPLYIDLIEILRALSEASPKHAERLVRPAILDILAVTVAEVPAFVESKSSGPTSPFDHSCFYHIVVLVQRWASANDISTRIASSHSYTCTVLETLSQSKDCVDLVVQCLGLYLSDQRTRGPFMHSGVARVLSSLSQTPLADGTLSNLVLAVYFMSKVASSREYLLTPPISMDRVFAGLSNHDNAKIKANVSRVYKNLNSDVNEAIEEGAVATLIAMSLEGKIRNQASDEFSTPPIRAFREFRCVPPSCREEVQSLQSETQLAPGRWFAKVIVTKGGAAGKGPDAPEPPQMATDGSAEYPPMLEELDGAEVEGRTKMAFAKMQVPATMRDLYLLGDSDFISFGKEADETNAAGSAEDADDRGNIADIHVVTDEGGKLHHSDSHQEGSLPDNGSLDSKSRGGSLRSLQSSHSQLLNDGEVDNHSSQSGGSQPHSRRVTRRHTTSSGSPSQDKKRSTQIKSRGSMRQENSNNAASQQAAKMGLYN